MTPRTTTGSTPHGVCQLKRLAYLAWLVTDGGLTMAQAWRTAFPELFP
jgi:hypothetical protein